MPAEGIVAAEEHREPVIGRLKARQVEGVGRAQGHGALQLSGRDGPPEIVVVAVNDLDGHAGIALKSGRAAAFSPRTRHRDESSPNSWNRLGSRVLAPAQLGEEGLPGAVLLGHVPP